MWVPNDFQNMNFATDSLNVIDIGNFTFVKYFNGNLYKHDVWIIS